MAVSLYLECLLALRQFQEIDDFVSSLDEKMKSDKEIDKILKKIKIVIVMIQRNTIIIMVIAAIALVNDLCNTHLWTVAMTIAILW